MNINDLLWWAFNLRHTEGCLIECPRCRVRTSHEAWIKGEQWCEDCCDIHYTIICPRCGEEIDLISEPELRTFSPQEAEDPYESFGWFPKH